MRCNVIQYDDVVVSSITFIVLQLKISFYTLASFIKEAFNYVKFDGAGAMQVALLRRT